MPRRSKRIDLARSEGVVPGNPSVLVMIRRRNLEGERKIGIIERNLVPIFSRKLACAHEKSRVQKEYSPQRHRGHREQTNRRWTQIYADGTSSTQRMPHQSAETPVTKIRLPWRFTPDSTSSVVEAAPNTFVISCSCFIENCPFGSLKIRAGNTLGYTLGSVS